MNGDARSLTASLPTEFDYDSQSGILFLLRAIRVADIDTADKNKLKDLVFLYNTDNKDIAVRNELVEKITALKVTPLCVLSDIKNQEKLIKNLDLPDSVTGFSFARPVPNFSVSALTNDSIPTPTPIKSFAPDKLVITQSEKTEATVPVVNHEKLVVSDNKPVYVKQDLPIRPTIPVPNKALVPESKDISAEEPNDIEISVKNTSVNQTAKEAERPVPVLELAEERMERIRVIKSDINSKVGNPVNLVDIDNAIGREYMSSLLEAMKLLSSASVADSAKAMLRLEASYLEVQSLLAAKKIDAESLEKAVTPELRVKRASPSDVISQVSPYAANDAEIEAAVIINNQSLRSKVIESDDEVMSFNSKNITSNVDIVPNVAKATVVNDSEAVARLSTPPAEQFRTVHSPAEETATPEVMSSVGTAVPLRAITELPTSSEVSAAEAMGNDPLYTKDVDAGLDQLLSEWSIFKKSGLFGTGPNGRMHPLYLKISTMQVPFILSGRFEGSTQEIKQSLTDYMNGWRYEQGIVYETNETLDQYLRRVIRHIIDLQKSKRRS